MNTRLLARRLAKSLLVLLVILLALYGVAWLTFADVRYVTRAAIAEAGILRRRRAIVELVADSTTDPTVRGKLLLVLAARAFARDSLRLAAGETFTTYSALDNDTLVIVLSAARNDKLEAYTWKYPVVGRVPYKGFFSVGEARHEQQVLERAGLDTYIRPASAFSTLGWFNDPLLSTTLRADSVELAATVIHEILHNTLFITGHVDFNESLAEFVGYHGAESFFRARGDSAAVHRVQARWRDELRLERYYGGIEDRLRKLYAADSPARDKLQARDAIFKGAQDQMAGPLAAELETISGRRLAERPLNNAVLLAQRVYGTGLARFDSVLALSNGDLRAAIDTIRRRVASGGDPWEKITAP